MRISTKGRYSLEALLYIALQSGNEYVSTRSIASSTGITTGYLEQLFIPLRKAGIVRGVRGPQGGYLPARPPETISVGEILRSVEGPLEPAACAAGDHQCDREAGCGPGHTWKELYRAITDCINSVSLADLAESYRSMDNPDYTI
jgi:Rrf2 family protein